MDASNAVAFFPNFSCQLNIRSQRANFVMIAGHNAAVTRMRASVQVSTKYMRNMYVSQINLEEIISSHLIHFPFSWLDISISYSYFHIVVEILVITLPFQARRRVWSIH